MKLNEFLVSTEDMELTKHLYIEINKQQYPLTDIKINNKKLMCLYDESKQPMTLKKFKADNEQGNAKLNLYKNIEQPMKIFGYRLDENKIILK